MIITTIELSFEEFELLISQTPDVNDDNTTDFGDNGDPSEGADLIPTDIDYRPIEEEEKAPTPVKKKAKSTKGVDRFLDIAKKPKDPDAEPEWKTVNGYEAAARIIGCHFTTIMVALKNNREEVKDYLVKWHTPRNK